MADPEATDLKRLPLHALHLSLGGKMVPFAGYEMPVQYPAGVMKEHLHTRSAAGLFDVSHMGQVILRPKAGMEALALAFEALMPVDVLGLPPGRQRYGLFTDADAGILDDLMFANRGDHLFVVVNAACKEADTAHLRAHLSAVAEVVAITDRALFALQGPQAETALGRLVPGVSAMRFMDVATRDWEGAALWISRSGYTGEDGFEISVPEGAALAFGEALLADPEVAPIGLGARDSLRLEAGLCLYGHDIDTTTTPVERASTGRSRRSAGPAAHAQAVSRAPTDPAGTGARPLSPPRGTAPRRPCPDARGHAAVPRRGRGGRDHLGRLRPQRRGAHRDGIRPAPLAAPGTALTGEVRGKRLPVTVCPLPFRPSTYKR